MKVDNIKALIGKIEDAFRNENGKYKKKIQSGN